ncbi:hypothetical protein JXL21_14040 [Candidatus Bathyarchaeota archaeon]|nr:hypothetical protein [Candidatus Bathyarchaeota archaeon]
MSDIDKESWQGVVEALRSRYGNDNFWARAITPYITELRLIQEADQTRVKASTNTFVQHLYRAFEESERYKLIPEEMRRFLESSGEATLLLGQRLTESVMSRDKLILIREMLENNKAENAKPECEECEFRELVESISYMINNDV